MGIRRGRTFGSLPLDGASTAVVSRDAADRDAFGRLAEESKIRALDQPAAVR